MTPKDHLVAFTKRYPKSWDIADDIRRDRNKYETPEWPAWCFLPTSSWNAIVGAHLTHLGKRPTFTDSLDVVVLAALGAWRYTQSIYCFDPDMLAAVSDTELSGELPVNVLQRLPEWCVYVEAQRVLPSGKHIDGFFAFLDHDADYGSIDLRIVHHVSDRLELTMTVPVGPWSVIEALDQIRQESKKYSPNFTMSNDDLTATAQDIYPLLSLLLYLCAEEPDISGHMPGAYPQYPQPKKTKKGLRLFPPDKPRVWHVGQEQGEKLRQAIENTSKRSPGSGTVTRKPHIRKAHWHGYWKGPRKPKPEMPPEQQERHFFYKWIPPLIIGAED